MDDPRDAEDATRELDGSRMCGRRVKVSFCLLDFVSPLLVPSMYKEFYSTLQIVEQTWKLFQKTAAHFNFLKKS